MVSSELTQVEVHQMAERLREEVLTIDRLSMFAQQSKDGQLSSLLERHRDQHARHYQRLLSVLNQQPAGQPAAGEEGQRQSASHPPYAGHEPAGYGTYRPNDGNHGDEYR